jgi:hypothetical protein
MGFAPRATLAVYPVTNAGERPATETTTEIRLT